jgi:hypothetical protein
MPRIIAEPISSLLFKQGNWMEKLYYECDQRTISCAVAFGLHQGFRKQSSPDALRLRFAPDEEL